MKSAKTDEKYKLVNVTKEGVLDEPATEDLLEQIADAKANNEPYTDVFITSHGWIADEQGARTQYNKWVDVMNFCDEGRELLVKKRGREQRKFRPLTIGIHWPSRPLADKNVDIQSLIVEGMEMNEETLSIFIASRLAETEPARQAIRDILKAVKKNPTPPVLPKPLIDLFHLIHKEENLSNDGVDGAPGNDAEKFDPSTIYELAKYDKSLIGRIPRGQSYEPEKDSSGAD